MRIEVDLDLCQGHGMCEMEAPDLFETQRDTVRVLDSEPGDAHRAELERAVQFCPTQALRIIED